MRPKIVTAAAHWLFRLRYLGRGVPTEIDREAFRFDESLRRWSFTSELPVHRALHEYLRPGGVFFDIGANFGQLAIPASGWVMPGGQVHAFEPVPRHAALLERHRRLNKLGNEFRIIDSAVSNDPADFLEFEVPVDEVAVEAGLHISYHAGPVEKLRVKNLRLDDYCLRTGVVPNVIKIDVEGAELEVLRGAEQTLRRARPVLVIEIHDFALPVYKTDVTEIGDYLRRVGYAAPMVIQTGTGEKAWHQAVFTPAPGFPLL